MALEPTQKRLTAPQYRDVARLQRMIDDRLDPHQEGGQEAWIRISGNIPEPVKVELIRRYKQAGWKDVTEQNRRGVRHFVFTSVSKSP